MMELLNASVLGGYSWYQALWMVLIYGMLGWCLEVGFAAVNSGKFVNRGFLNGPICPIYGFGATIVILLLTPLEKNLFLLFAGSFVLTSLLEWLTGFVLEKIFHEKWWDYSEVPFNIGGYICLEFSLAWGFACVFVMRVVHPLILGLINWVPDIAGTMILLILWAAFFSDCAITVAGILKFKKQLRLALAVGERLKELSDSMGENIFEGITGLREKGEAVKEELEKKKEEAEALKEKYERLLAAKNWTQHRHLKAFPNLKKIWENRKGE